MIKSPEEGQRVRYSSQFISKIGSAGQPEVVDLRGTITKKNSPCGKFFYVKVMWDGDCEEKSCLSCNLEPA